MKNALTMNHISKCEWNENHNEDARQVFVEYCGFCRNTSVALVILVVATVDCMNPCYNWYETGICGGLFAVSCGCHFTKYTQCIVLLRELWWLWGDFHLIRLGWIIFRLNRDLFISVADCKVKTLSALVQFAKTSSFSSRPLSVSVCVIFFFFKYIFFVTLSLICLLFCAFSLLLLLFIVFVLNSYCKTFVLSNVYIFSISHSI